ncbi:MAG TPA: hypothetical protein VIT38_07550 [Allosphingosinicella sp.]
MSGRLAQLSLRGLRMAAAGLPADQESVARWLYHFGTHPAGPALERDFGMDDEPMAVLGLTRGGPARARIERHFDASTHKGWISFARAGAPALTAPACKLYVSPRPEALASAFPIVADVFAGARIRSFKVGRGLQGLLRPDKIVAYFDDRAHLDETARHLARRLRHCSPQGVPFTEDAGGDGLLSAGVDPPDPGEGASWRAWITRKLAKGLIVTRRIDRVGAALDSIRAAGVDPETWALLPERGTDGWFQSPVPSPQSPATAEAFQ